MSVNCKLQDAAIAEEATKTDIGWGHQIYQVIRSPISS